MTFLCLYIAFSVGQLTVCDPEEDVMSDVASGINMGNDFLSSYNITVSNCASHCLL